MNIEIIRNTLYKSYLESFYNFCKNIGGETEEVMCPILAVSQTRRPLMITFLLSICTEYLFWVCHSSFLLRVYSELVNDETVM